MRLPRIFLLVLLASLCRPDAAPAHRVNLFAHVDGGVARVECFFSRGAGVRQGRVEVLDAVSGETILFGYTDERGVFSFPAPENAARAGHDLLVRVNAGEGHRGECLIPAGDFAGAGREENFTPPPGALSGAGEAPGEAWRVLDREEMEKLLEAKLAPLRRMLAERSEPAARDIVGGLGWIVGLAGLAAYFRRR